MRIANPKLLCSARDVPEVAPGVRAIVLPGDPLTIVTVQAMVEGAGFVGAFLDSLPRNRAILVPCVISPRLEGMLARRGFVCIDAEENDWRRGATTATSATEGPCPA